MPRVLHRFWQPHPLNPHLHSLQVPSLHNSHRFALRNRAGAGAGNRLEELLLVPRYPVPGFGFVECTDKRITASMNARAATHAAASTSTSFCSCVPAARLSTHTRSHRCVGGRRTTMMHAHGQPLPGDIHRFGSECLAVTIICYHMAGSSLHHRCHAAPSPAMPQSTLQTAQTMQGHQVRRLLSSTGFAFNSAGFRRTLLISDSPMKTPPHGRRFASVAAEFAEDLTRDFRGSEEEWVERRKWEVQQGRQSWRESLSFQPESLNGGGATVPGTFGDKIKAGFDKVSIIAGHTCIPATICRVRCSFTRHAGVHIPDVPTS